MKLSTADLIPVTPHTQTPTVEATSRTTAASTQLQLSSPPRTVPTKRILPQPTKSANAMSTSIIPLSLPSTTRLTRVLPFQIHETRHARHDDPIFLRRLRRRRQRRTMLHQGQMRRRHPQQRRFRHLQPLLPRNLPVCDIRGRHADRPGGQCDRS